MPIYQSVQMNNGKVFNGEQIKELTEFVINKFSNEKLSYDEAIIVMRGVEDVLGESAIVSPIRDA